MNLQQRFTGDIPEYFECPICLSTALSPISHSRCETIFCLTCIQRLGIGQALCPVCRDPFDNNTKLNRHVMTEYLKIKVKCINFPECQQIYNLSEDSNHKNNCDLTIILCQYNCTFQCQRKDMDNHYHDCPYFPVNCQFCHIQVNRIELPTHLVNCDLHPGMCGSCKFTLNRVSYTKHEETCTDLVISCPVDGCEFRDKRSCIDNHLRDNAIDHMYTLIETVENIQNTGIIPAVSNSKYPFNNYQIPFRDIICGFIPKQDIRIIIGVDFPGEMGNIKMVYGVLNQRMAMDLAKMYCNDDDTFLVWDDSKQMAWIKLFRRSGSAFRNIHTFSFLTADKMDAEYKNNAEFANPKRGF
mmetsp:Transcript_12474/g.11309  ORF Transcript_12474/g.11309 Transcript_12474/m.11309 type:complete len:355 (+) Transcript_12474:82-1146(+)